MVNKGNIGKSSPNGRKIQVSEKYYFTQMVVVFVWVSDHFVDISSFKKVAYSDKTVYSEVFAVPFVTEVNLKGFKNGVEMFWMLFRYSYEYTWKGSWKQWRWFPDLSQARSAGNDWMLKEIRVQVNFPSDHLKSIHWYPPLLVLFLIDVIHWLSLPGATKTMKIKGPDNPTCYQLL